MIPFFVADRPMSLQILQGLPLQRFPGVKIGIMSHANTTSNFQQAFRDYTCPNTVKMCDSGIFTREGATLTYEELFETYERMGVEYGIMIDVFLDAQATLDSARKALPIYEPYREKFKLVGVAQGTTVEDYLNCYAELKQMGFEYVAVGGLLRRRANTVRFPYVRDEDFMTEVLSKLRHQYPNDWLFALGCFHPNRLPVFQKLDVWADYKGWIFQYKKRDEVLDTQLSTLTSNHFEHLENLAFVRDSERLKRLISQRAELVNGRTALCQQLIAGRRILREELHTLYQELQQGMPDMAAEFRELTTHALLDSTEESRVIRAIEMLGEQSPIPRDRILENVQRNRMLRQQQKEQDEKIKQLNAILADDIEAFLATSPALPRNVADFITDVAQVLNATEQEHRLKQVRDWITDNILTIL